MTDVEKLIADVVRTLSQAKVLAHGVARTRIRDLDGHTWDVLEDEPPEEFGAISELSIMMVDPTK